jgi:hypothetical protein
MHREINNAHKDLAGKSKGKGLFGRRVRNVRITLK